MQRFSLEIYKTPRLQYGEEGRVPEAFQVAWLGKRGSCIALSFYVEFCVVLLFEFWPFYMPFAPHTV